MRHLPILSAPLLAPFLLAACTGVQAKLDKLNVAVEKGDAATMRAELSNGADPCARQPDGNAALDRGRRREVRLELVGAAAERGCPAALYYAAKYGKVDLVRRLLDRGIHPDEPGELGWTPLTGAAAGPSDFSPQELDAKFESARLLLERGADPNA